MCSRLSSTDSRLQLNRTELKWWCPKRDSNPHGLTAGGFSYHYRFHGHRCLYPGGCRFRVGLWCGFKGLACLWSGLCLLHERLVTLHGLLGFHPYAGYFNSPTRPIASPFNAIARAAFLVGCRQVSTPSLMLDGNPSKGLARR